VDRVARGKPKAERTLSEILLRRLSEPASRVPYASQLAEKLCGKRKGATLGDVIVDIMCLYAVKGSGSVLRSLWERCEGRPSGPRQSEQMPPRRVVTPLKEPKRRSRAGRRKS